jgi:hypothetical protein
MATTGNSYFWSVNIVAKWTEIWEEAHMEGSV